MMRKGATPYRESLIRLVALRLRYRRACRNPSAGVTDLAALLSEVEDAERDVERYEQKYAPG
ncbi:hypothetical protein AC790_18610 [Pantoea sp. RIT-PI-b]|jgi:hypothetical protein|uniref:hypothetical protein n=1 Tax=Pantoea TaxID=53335 RepID=UPI000675FBB0|nr:MULTISPECIES: hypothetical protein [Pantoea]KNC07567.1 hypothetical protein AC790_18610 [Pantoea sp. RIT-PI-b]